MSLDPTRQLVAAHQADLEARARRRALARVARPTSGGRLRSAGAGLLLTLAAAVRPVPQGAEPRGAAGQGASPVAGQPRSEKRASCARASSACAGAHMTS